MLIKRWGRHDVLTCNAFMWIELQWQDGMGAMIMAEAWWYRSLRQTLVQKKHLNSTFMPSFGRRICLLSQRIVMPIGSPIIVLYGGVCGDLHHGVLV
ncbi:hypothetical protein O9992_25450 [Vibrio lentus]|nr:hypothetical protein [Vibrio lentus]